MHVGRKRLFIVSIGLDWPLVTISYSAIILIWHHLEASQGQVPLPSHFDPSNFTLGAFDNFKHEEDTLSGIGGSHDTVMILMQDKRVSQNSKPKLSETGVTHRERQFTQELGCQTMLSYTMNAKKPSLPTMYEVPEELYEIDESHASRVSRKDVAWTVRRFD